MVWFYNEGPLVLLWWEIHQKPTNYCELTQIDSMQFKWNCYKLKNRRILYNCKNIIRSLELGYCLTWTKAEMNNKYSKYCISNMRKSLIKIWNPNYYLMLITTQGQISNIQNTVVTSNSNFPNSLTSKCQAKVYLPEHPMESLQTIMATTA